jgi:single-stranded-DNA-specific exonuclease
VEGFIDPLAYSPTPASAFGSAMTQAVERLKQALARSENVAIWGDFDADGVTATAVLWDGLGQLWPKHHQLTYYIPNRLTASHGLSTQGLDQLKAWGASLIVTCDTGSTNAAELAYAQALGLDVIVTDHHTLPEVAPPVVALINPRHFPPEHPLATLSGVAVAYKLLEAFYAALDTPPLQPLEHLLDLVAIGLIADLVELRGDCRYLAQMGLAQLQTQQQPDPPYQRPGVAELLSLCRGTGDRPTDISFGLGPRINAVSRIHGDASFCVELLTSQDAARCKVLAYEAELANTRRKALQKDIYNQVMQRVAQLDLATTQCLVLADEQWPVGVLGLVAGQVSQQLGRPTVLLRIDADAGDGSPRLARGSARSVKGLDLYALFKAQAELLTGFGGHPLAAGLTLPVEHIAMFTAALNRTVRECLGEDGLAQPSLTIDLTVTVADLGQPLFRELKWLEPYGMGNPVPRLLIRNGWFQRAFHKKLRDSKGQTVGFIKTEFELWDDTAAIGFPGEWWGHYKDELPEDRCDVVVELDHNRFSGYHVKLVDVRLAEQSADADSGLATESGAVQSTAALAPTPAHWSDWPIWQQRAIKPDPLTPPVLLEPIAPVEKWQELVGLAKYLVRTQTPVSRPQLANRLNLTPTALNLGLVALSQVGFALIPEPETDATFRLQPTVPAEPQPHSAIQYFLEAVVEEQFRHCYLAQGRAR